MNIKNIINQIIDLDNENKSLKQKLNLTYPKCEAISVEKVESKFDIATKEIFLIGLSKTLGYSENVFGYHDLFNKDTRKFLKLEEWLSTVKIDNYYRRDLPTFIQENFSNKEIIEFYKPYLIKKYEKLVEEKKVELMEEGKK